MGDMGYGYGSECHLLRFMGRHRKRLDGEILSQSGLHGRIVWDEFEFDIRRAWPDQEIGGLDFLPADHPVRVEWETKWPQSGTPPNWDAVGRLATPSGKEELLLVEAKANLAEIFNAKGCGAKPGSDSWNRIESFFAEARRRLEITQCGDWMGGYYQFANRAAILEFLNRRNVPSRLIMIYFIGDRGFAGRECPAKREDWRQALLAQDREILGNCGEGEFLGRIHKVFMHVLGQPQAQKEG